MSYIKRWLESMGNDPEAVRRRLLASGEPYVALQRPGEDARDGLPPFETPPDEPDEARPGIDEINEELFD